MRPIVLLLLATTLLGQEEERLVFGKDPVACAPIECEVQVPVGWKVAQDHTGMSAQGDGMGFVITREPLLESEKTFGGTWERLLAAGGIVAKVSTARAGRYKAFRAEWEPKSAPGRVVEVYRVHVPDQEMLFNISFSFPKEADREALIKGVLKSFKSTSSKAKLELQKTAVAMGAATIKLPVGYAKINRAKMMGWRFFSEGYASVMKGYTPPRRSGVILFREFPAGQPLGGGSGTTSKTDEFAAFLANGAASQFGTPVGKPKTKTAKYGAFKGHARTGTYRDSRGDTRELYLFAGKSKQKVVAVLFLVHERELKVHKKYFSTVLRTLKAKK